jgi:hypothetical protein
VLLYVDVGSFQQLLKPKEQQIRHVRSSSLNLLYVRGGELAVEQVSLLQHRTNSPLNKGTIDIEEHCSLGVFFQRLFWMGKGLSVTYMLYLPKVKLCQLTVHSPKLEKSALKPPKSRLKRRLPQAQKPEPDATMRSV